MYNRPQERNAGSSLKHDALPNAAVRQDTLIASEQLPRTTTVPAALLTSSKSVVDSSTMTRDFVTSNTRGTQTHSAMGATRQAMHKCMQLRATVKKLRNIIRRLRTTSRMKRLREKHREEAGSSKYLH